MLTIRAKFMISFPRLLLALVLVALLPLQAGIAAEPAQPAPEAAAAPVAQPAPAPHPQAGSDFGEAGREMGVDINAKIGEWSGEFDRIDKDLDKNPRYRDLDRYRQRLDDIRGDTDRFLDGLRPKVDAFRAQVDSLGPAPAKDQPAEPEAVAKQRSDWNATLGSLAVAQNAAEAAKLRANQIVSKIQDIRRRRFTEQLFERVPEAYSLNAWENAPRQIVYAIGQAGGAVANWWML
jgi:potassium efflux system protein